MEHQRVIGIDWGKSKIGLALGDTDSRLALPLKTVKNWAELMAIIEAEEISVAVLGQPLSLAGEDQRFTQGFAGFLARLRESGLTVHLVDERFSSKAAQQLQRQQGKRQAADEDALAAMLILQQWLDSQ